MASTPRILREVQDSHLLVRWVIRGWLWRRKHCIVCAEMSRRHDSHAPRLGSPQRSGKRRTLAVCSQARLWASLVLHSSKSNVHHTIATSRRSSCRMWSTIGIPERDNAIISSCDQIFMSAIGSSETHCQDFSICCLPAFSLSEVVVVSLISSQPMHL